MVQASRLERYVLGCLRALRSLSGAPASSSRYRNESPDRTMVWPSLDDRFNETARGT